ncbi:MAG TPA: hypothetical protein VHD87_15675 [Acidimicrobiales bacterium]|nr:hypothetical protein [Acidimicrobiales bacterium]
MDTVTVPVGAGLAGVVGNAMCAYTRPRLLAGYQPNCCVLATAIAVDVFGYFGIPARALPVYAEAYNAAFVDAVSRGVEPDPATCRVVQIDFHLVAYLPREHALLDLTLDQASRPDRNLELSPLFAYCPPEFNPHGGEFALGNTDGTAVAYNTVLKQSPPNWRRSADWTDRRRRRGLVAETIRLLTR